MRSTSALTRTLPFFGVSATGCTGDVGVDAGGDTGGGVTTVGLESTMVGSSSGGSSTDSATDCSAISSRLSSSNSVEMLPRSCMRDGAIGDVMDMSARSTCSSMRRLSVNRRARPAAAGVWNVSSNLDDDCTGVEGGSGAAAGFCRSRRLRGLGWTAAASFYEQVSGCIGARLADVRVV
jgi:hypothetical protein